MYFCVLFRPHCSSGDLKNLDPAPAPAPAPAPPASSLPKQGDAELRGTRRRANTFSHSPVPPSVEHSLIHTPRTQKVAASASSKLIRHYSLSSEPPHQSKWGSVCHRLSISSCSHSCFCCLHLFFFIYLKYCWQDDDWGENYWSCSSALQYTL